MERSLIFKNKKLGKTKTKKLRHFVFFGSYVYTYKVHLCRIVLGCRSGVPYVYFIKIHYYYNKNSTVYNLVHTHLSRRYLLVGLFPVLLSIFLMFDIFPTSNHHLVFAHLTYTFISLEISPTTHLLPLTHSLSSTMAFLSVLTGEYNAPSTNANLSSFRCFLASNFNSLDISYAVP